MARFLKNVFPAANAAKNEVCSIQDGVANTALLLNGSLYNSVASLSSIPFMYYGYARNISITSANNLAGVNFTITGKQNGGTITEVLAGPNNTTVYSTETYEEILSIVPDGAAAAVRVGAGPSGYFKIINIDHYMVPLTYNLNVRAQSGATLQDIGLYGSNEDIVNNGLTVDFMLDANIVHEIITPAAALFTWPGIAALAGAAPDIPFYSDLLVTIVGDGTTLGTALTLTFKQG